MSQAELAAGLDRLPWLTDETPARQLRHAAASAVAFWWARRCALAASPADPIGWARRAGGCSELARRWRPVRLPFRCRRPALPQQFSDKRRSRAIAPAIVRQAPQPQVRIPSPSVGHAANPLPPIRSSWAAGAGAGGHVGGAAGGAGHCTGQKRSRRRGPTESQAARRRPLRTADAVARARVVGRLWPAGPDRRVRLQGPGQARLVGDGPRLSRRQPLPAVVVRSAATRAAGLSTAPDRHDVAGAQRGAVPAHGEDSLQLRGRRPAAEAQGDRALSDARPNYDEQLPWLQAVEDEDEPRGLSARKMLAALVVVLLAALIVAATFFWLGRARAATSGPPELIQAPTRAVQGQAGRSRRARRRRRERDGVRDQRRRGPGCPARSGQASRNAGRQAPAPQAGAASRTGEPSRLAARARSRAGAGGAAGSVIQLGAFANQAQAERAWTALSARFPTIAAMSKLVVPFSGGIRLRAGGGVAGRRQAGVPGAQGRRRKLLRGAIGSMQAAIFGLAGFELTDDERRFLPRRRARRLHPVQAQLRQSRTAARLTDCCAR